MNDDLTFLGEYGWLTMVALLSALVVSGAALFLSNGPQVSIEHPNYPPVRYASNSQTLGGGGSGYGETVTERLTG